MPQQLKSIGKIARKKHRDVLLISFIDHSTMIDGREFKLNSRINSVYLFSICQLPLATHIVAYVLHHTTQIGGHHGKK